MRLVQKLSLAFIVTTSTIIAVGGVVRAQREVGVLEFDRVRDHHLMGRALGAAIAAVWHSDGEARALSVLDRANVPEGRVHARWVWLEGGPPDVKPAFDVAAVEGTPVGDTITRVVPSLTGSDPSMRYTYVPLAVDPHRRGALELSESLAGQRRFTRRVVLETIVTTAIFALASAGLSTLLGIWIVGRPIEALAAKARRVGQGDFTAPLVLPQRDELGELAREMNTMCERLVALHRRIEEETAKKTAIEEQLRHADRLTTVGKLASGIAHELGTPLNVVMARGEMISEDEGAPPLVRDYGRVIVEATEKMTRIIGQLLDFARRKKRIGGAVGSCALEPLARNVLGMLGPLAAKREVTLMLDVPAAQETHVPADAHALEQVITNLVINGVQAMTAPGTVAVRVREVLARPPANVGEGEIRCAAIAVTDTGTGIDAKDIPHVFEPFFTTKDVGEGTGLGLSVAYGIVEDHGGWIAVESEVGKGTTFTVFLPVAANA